MEDRLKFRAWDKLNKKMYLPEEEDDILHYTGDYYSADIIYQNLDLKDVDPLNIDGEQLILMQCTGLKDKNGKLIYEGDILKGVSDNLKEYPLPLFNVFWEEAYSGYAIELITGDHVDELFEKEFVLQTEVVGNIYENSDNVEFVKRHS